MNNSFVTQDYWDDSYQQLAFAVAPAQDPLRVWIEANMGEVVPQKGARCIEVGCFPGRYLAIFGEKGYRLSGVDLTPRVADELPTWLSDQGFAVDEFYRGDFRSFSSSTTFDVVCSFGFIEHFHDWQDILRKHCQLVAPGGTLVVSAPNFAGLFQRFLHSSFDRRNLARHNLASMAPEKWAKIAREEGLEVSTAGYFGKFDFWVDNEPRGPFQKRWLDRTMRVLPLLQRLPEGPRLYTPYCGLVARRT